MTVANLVDNAGTCIDVVISKRAIERLTPEGTLAAVGESGWLGVRPEEVERLLTEEYDDDTEFVGHVKGWARDVLVPRLDQGNPR